MIFWIFITLVIAQRLIEMRIAKRNEKWILTQGGYEVGHGHYKYIVLMHILFFVSLMVEVVYFNKELSTFYPVLFFLICVNTVREIVGTSIVGDILEYENYDPPDKTSAGKRSI